MERDFLRSKLVAYIIHYNVNIPIRSILIIKGQPREVLDHLPYDSTKVAGTYLSIRKEPCDIEWTTYIGS